MKRLQSWITPFAIVAIPALLGGCTEKIESDPETQTSLAAAPSLSLASTPSVNVEGSYQTFLYSERDVEIYNRLAGGGFYEQGVIVEDIHVEVGARVSAGQLLAVLEDDEVVIRLEAGQAKVDEAAAAFSRAEELREREVISQSEYDQILASKRLAEAELARARLDLTRTRVRAPFDGMVSRRYVREGELVDFGMGLFRVTAMTPLRARLLVPESEAAAFRVGAEVELVGAGELTATAKVIVIGPTIDAASGTREVVVELSEPGGFRPGAAVVAKPLPMKEGE